MGIGNENEEYGHTRATNIEQLEYEKELWAKRITEVPSNMQARYSYDGSNNLIYAGYAPKGLAEGTDGWLLQKYTYDGSNNVTERKIYYGNWTAKGTYTFE